MALLTSALTDRAPGASAVRLGAVQALAEIAVGQDPVAVAAVSSCLDDADPDVRAFNSQVQA